MESLNVELSGRSWISSVSHVVQSCTWRHIEAGVRQREWRAGGRILRKENSSNSSVIREREWHKPTQIRNKGQGK